MKTETETIGETLQRLARESLPRHFDGGGGEYNSRRYCDCGEYNSRRYCDCGEYDSRRYCDCGEYDSRRYCDCGEPLPVTPKTRRRRLVCDDCAAVIPRETSGRRSTHTCAGCHAITPRRKMKMKNRELYCKKCLKIKFKIDF